MFLIKIDNEEKITIIYADEFKVTNDSKYVYFYKVNKKVAMIRMDNVRAILRGGVDEII